MVCATERVIGNDSYHSGSIVRGASIFQTTRKKEIRHKKAVGYYVTPNLVSGFGAMGIALDIAYVLMYVIN